MIEADPVREVLGRCAPALLSAAATLPQRETLGLEIGCVDRAAERGYFLPDEESLIRERYTQYLALRAVILEIQAELQGLSGSRRMKWERMLPVFLTAFAASCVMDRADRYVVELAASRPVVWKKLDEEDPCRGLPRKSFTRIYSEFSSPLAMARQVRAVDFYLKHREELLALAADPALEPVVALMREEEPRMDHWLKGALRRRIGYRWFSFLRRHRSAWKQVMFGIFEASGRMVADLHVPGIKPAGAPKRIGVEARQRLMGLMRHGDVVVTRHDDALSNWFLPGFWPHAALFLGGSAEFSRWSGRAPEPGKHWFLESKKDGVKVRLSEETLQVDALVVLRPPLDGEDLDQGLRQALIHEGKPYDFVFDFRTADRMVCTEVVYRGFHGIGPVQFHLEPASGRLCLPAEKFLQQALACGFQVVATAGLRGDGVLIGEEALEAFAHAAEESPS